MVVPSSESQPVESAFSDSDPVTVGPLSLEGLWIHDPDDAQETVRQYRLGRDMRSMSRNVGGTKQVFAGRRYPVMDFGEHQDDQYSVGLQVANGPDYNANRKSLVEFLEMKKTLCFRDNRGTAVFGAMSELPDQHENYGSSISFEVTRVFRERIEVI